MKYYTENELQNFRFEGAYIAETCAVNGIFEMILDNVTILPQNSCNRDIREMRANELKLKIREPEIAAEDQAAKLKELEGCEIYSIEQEKGVYTVSIDTEDHTFMIKVSGSADAEEWDRFLSKD